MLVLITVTDGSPCPNSTTTPGRVIVGAEFAVLNGGWVGAPDTQFAREIAPGEYLLDVEPGSELEVFTQDFLSAVVTTGPAEDVYDVSLTLAFALITVNITDLEAGGPVLESFVRVVLGTEERKSQIGLSEWQLLVAPNEATNVEVGSNVNGGNWFQSQVIDVPPLPAGECTTLGVALENPSRVSPKPGFWQRW
jgi:hypothetical protein